MAGLVPAIHALVAAKTWMRGSSPRMTSIQTNGTGLIQKNNPEPVHRPGLSDLLPGRARGRGAKERSATATCKIGANLAGGQNLFGQSLSNRLNFA